MKRRRRCPWLLVVLSGAPACGKTDSAPPDASLVDLPPLASAEPTSTSTSTSKPVALHSDGGKTCGAKDLPDCPLQSWMKSHLAPPLASGDLDELAASFDKLVPLGPPGYANWIAIAKDGANAAHEASIEGVRGACRGCHEQYKARYREEMRPRALP